VIQIGHPGLPGESHSTLHGTLANRIEGMTILGAELGVFIVNANGVQFSRVEISARKYDKGDMNAAMILANGFDHTFNHVSFWGFQADYVDCYKGGLHAAHPKCHGAPSVILRGVGPPGAAHFPVGGHLWRRRVVGARRSSSALPSFCQTTQRFSCFKTPGIRSAIITYSYWYMYQHS